jgi:hypothetical protein
MGQINANFILGLVSYRLLEPVVNTNPSAPIATGIQMVTPLSMSGIYQGALLIVGTGVSIEVVDIISVTASTFTASFVNAHLATEPIYGATFPSGQPNTPLWSQEEMLQYLVDVQNDFLAAVRPVYKIATQTLSVGIAAYPNPADAIRVERLSINGTELWNATQTDIDWQGGYSARAGTQPQYWYQDKVGAFTFAVDPVPQTGYTARLFYSQSGSPTLGLLDTLTVPDLFWPALSWGVCGVALSKDGEQRDLSRSAIAQQKFTWWELLAGKFIDGIEARFMGKEETVEPLVEMK